MLPTTPNENPADPLWNHHIMHIQEAIALAGTRGEGINVAILDTGVDYNHPNIRDRFNHQKRGYNFLPNQHPNEPMDSENHGTLVARILAGEYEGIAPGVNLYAVKVFDVREEEVDTQLNILRGLDWCRANDIDVVNMSFGGPLYDQNLHSKCKMTYRNNKKDMLLVASAGNSETGAHFPASFPEVISVAAIEPYIRHCTFSNVWPSVNISASGRQFSPLNEATDYVGYEVQGTSFSCPQVSAVIALGLAMLKKHNKIASAQEIAGLLNKTALDVSCAEGIQEVVNSWIPIYDPARNLFENDRTLVRCMYGAGILQADGFIKALKELKSIF